MPLNVVPGIGIPPTMDSGLQLQHSPTVQCPKPSTSHCLHSQHVAETFVLDTCKQFHEQIHSHIIGSNQVKFNRLVSNALPDEVVTHIDVLHHSMVDGVPHE